MLLKNVQDGISRPLGNRAIQKTKVETDLLDTLYKKNYETYNNERKKQVLASNIKSQMKRFR